VLHARLAGYLNCSVAVGISHQDQFAPRADVVGPKHKFFFAPSQFEKRKKDWGKGVIEDKIDKATWMIIEDAARWLTFDTHAGLISGMASNAALVAGSANTKIGHMVEV